MTEKIRRDAEFNVFKDPHLFQTKFCITVRIEL